MAAITKYPEPLVFGLDIGTRSIVGTVGYKDKDNFNIVAMSVKYHDTRSMIDGQIHDINKVSEDILAVKTELEEQLNGRKLHDVCIAAAGRVLKTAVGKGVYEFPENTTVTQEYIHSLELIGIERAHEQILEELSEDKETTKYFCVGYTVVKYYLNDYEITNLEGHKGTKICADVLATFLPEEVVTSLYSAVEQAGLYVTNLTLEPIAAINVAIPEHYRLLNIALVDVGAGTSDICITKDGSIIGYGMIPFAGDEMTELIVKKYLVDFKTAEKLKTASSKRKSVTYKDIMGISHKITPDEIKETIDGVIDNITKKIAEKIIDLNGGMTVSAVFIVGGGGKGENFAPALANYLDLPVERVALRGPEVMTNINFLIDNIKKDSLYVTPIGICLNFYDQKNNFILVNVNGERVKLYNNDKLTIFDAAIQYGLPNEKIFPRRGEDITFKINGKSRIVRGHSGDAAVIKLNGKTVGMNAVIEANDKIEIVESTVGDNAQIELGSLPEFKGTFKINVNGMVIDCPKLAMVNGKAETQLYNIQNNDNIVMQSYYTVEQLLKFMDVEPMGDVKVNNQFVDNDFKIYENFEVSWQDGVYETVQINETDKSNPSNNKIESESTNIEKNTDSVEENADEKEEIHNIKVIINNTPVILSGKSSYAYVDILDFYDFDLTQMRGKLVTLINKNKAEFIDSINDGDIIDIYWE